MTVVIRDGRDTVVSAYYYMCFKNEINRQFGVDRYRKALQFEDYDDIRSNLPRFIEYLYGEHAKNTSISAGESLLIRGLISQPHSSGTRTC